MAEQSEASEPSDVLKKKKKKDQVRSAWISFTGRIIAQLVGAVATVVLGVIVLHKAQSRTDMAAVASAQREPATQADRVATGRPVGEPAIAVLSFQNYSRDPREDGFADALTERLISDLSQVDAWRVVSRTSSSVYKDQHRPLPDIARELGAAYIVEGSIVRTNGRLRVVAQLIDAASDQHVWARSYDRPLRDPLDVQAEVAAAIARDVSAVLGTTPGHPRVAAARRPDVSEPSH